MLEYFINNGYILLFCTITAIVLFGMALYYWQKKILDSNNDKIIIKIIKIFVNAIYIPIILFLTLFVLCYPDNYILTYLDAEVVKKIRDIHTISHIWLFWMFIARITNNIKNIVVKKNTDGTKVTLFMAFFTIISFLAYTIMAFSILQKIGLKIKGIVQLLGGPTFIIGFAAKELISNYISGLILLMNNEFRKNDKVEFVSNKIEGTIIHIDIKTTKIQTIKNEIIYVPNSLIVNSLVIKKKDPKTSTENVEVFVEKDNYPIINTLCKDIKQIIINANIRNVKNDSITVFCTQMAKTLQCKIDITFKLNTVKSDEIKKIKQQILTETLNVINSYKHKALS